jgi:hypothetical protein
MFKKQENKHLKLKGRKRKVNNKSKQAFSLRLKEQES